MTRPNLDPLPWERQRGETGKAWLAFVAYRDMGPTRTLRSLADQLNKSLALVGDWSGKYGWRARVESWDSEVDRKARESTIEEVAAMHKRHASIARYWQGMVQKRILGDEATNITALDPNRWTARDCVLLYVEMVKVERHAMGEAEQLVAIRNASAPAPAQLDDRIFDDPDLLAAAEDLAAKMLERQPRARGLHAVAS